MTNSAASPLFRIPNGGEECEHVGLEVVRLAHDDEGVEGGAEIDVEKLRDCARGDMLRLLTDACQPHDSRVQI
jgi:hypothetical protein